MDVVKGKGIRVMCTHCGRERFYIPQPGTRAEDLGNKRVQCFFCGKSFKVVQ